MGLINALQKAADRILNHVADAPKRLVDRVNGGLEEWTRAGERASRWGWNNPSGHPLGKYPPVPNPVVPPKALNYASHGAKSGLKLKVALPGALPADLSGSYYVQVTTGTGSTGLPRYGNQPIFNSDGCVVRIDFTPAAGPVPASAEARKDYIQTASWFAERVTRGALLPHTSDPLGQWMVEKLVHHNPLFRYYNLGLIRQSILLGTRNMVNTGFMVWKDPAGAGTRMAATWDAGRPWELDSSSMDAASPIGTRAEWRPPGTRNGPFPLIFTSAHPAWDQVAGEGFLVDYARGVAELAGENALASELIALAGAILAGIERVGSTLPGIGPSLFAVLRQLFQWGMAWADALLPIVMPFEIDGYTNLKRWDGAGGLRDYRLVHDGSDVSMSESCHQMSVTESHVLLMDTGFKVSVASVLASGLTRFGRARTVRAFMLRRVKEVAPLYIVPRASFAAADVVRAGNQGAGHVDPTPDVDVTRVDLRGQASHFVADYLPNNKGNLVVYVAHSSFTDVGEFIQAFDRRALRTSQRVLDHVQGLPHLASLDLNPITRYEIDPSTGGLVSTRTLCTTPFSWTVALVAERSEGRAVPRTERIEHMYWVSLGFHESLVTEEIHQLYESADGLSSSEELKRKIASLASIPCTLFRVDTQGMEVGDSWTFTAGEFVSSPQFVPRPGATPGVHPQRDGWIVLIVFPPDNAVGGPAAPQFKVFDANNLAGGPLCSLEHDQLRFGYSVHTAWLDAAEVAPRKAGYKVPPSDLTEGLTNVIVSTLLDYEIVPRL